VGSQFGCSERPRCLSEIGIPTATKTGWIGPTTRTALAMHAASRLRLPQALAIGFPTSYMPTIGTSGFFRYYFEAPDIPP
jgi:hypothetical protein